MALDWKAELDVDRVVIEDPTGHGSGGSGSGNVLGMMEYVKETQELFRLEGRGLRESTGGFLDKEMFLRCLARTELGLFSSFLFFPLLSSSFLFFPLLSSSFLFVPLLSSSFLFFPLLSSSFLFFPLLSSSFLFFSLLSSSSPFFSFFPPQHNHP
jgi:hypothetical protein